MNFWSLKKYFIIIKAPDLISYFLIGAKQLPELSIPNFKIIFSSFLLSPKFNHFGSLLVLLYVEGEKIIVHWGIYGHISFQYYFGQKLKVLSIYF